MNIEHLSHSALDDFKSCPEKFRLGRDLKLPKRPGWSLAGGSAVHTVTEALDLLDLGVPTDKPSNFNDAFAAAVEDLEQRSGFARTDWYIAGRKSAKYPNKEDQAWWLENGPVMVEKYKGWRKYTPTQIWVTPAGEPAVELSFTVILNGIPFVGHVDRVEEDPSTGELIVVDIKTGSRIPKPDQLGEYVRSLASVFPSEQFRWGAFWMARTGTLTVPEPLSRFHDGRVEWEVGELWKVAQSGSYGPARPSDLCGSCGVNKYCYSYSEGKDIDKPY